MKVFLGLIIGLTLAFGFSTHQDANKEAEDYHFTHLSGRSMEQYGFYDGTTIKLLHKAPLVGDFVSFRCINDKCPHDNMLKKLVSQDLDCYWFQGRDDKWLNEKGEERWSLDSRTYGWVCKKDIIINGIVPHETHPQETKVLVSERNLPTQPICTSEAQSDYPKTRVLRGDATPQDIH